MLRYRAIPMNELHRVACHEAGHAAAGLAAGLAVTAVTISAENGDGQTCLAYSRSGEDREIAAAHLFAVLAGPAAEHQVAGVNRSHAHCHRSDFAAAWNLARSLSGGDESEAAATLGRTRREAECFVARNKDVIGALANELIRRGRLEGAEVERVLSAALDLAESRQGAR